VEVLASLVLISGLSYKTTFNKELWTSIARRPSRNHTGGAGFVVVLLLILIALARAQLAPTQDQVTAQRIIIREWPTLQDACTAPTVQRVPDGKLHAWCRNGERFLIELTSPPLVLRCDTVFRGVLQCRW
jgi:hypothetical protein